MEINLLNTEAFANQAFEQVHETYKSLRADRKKVLAKVREEAAKQLEKELMNQNHWWKVSNFEGVTLGYGYGTAKNVCGTFTEKAYQSAYDVFYVELLPNGEPPLKKAWAPKCELAVSVNMVGHYNLPEFKALEKELERKGLVLPKID